MIVDNFPLYKEKKQVNMQNHLEIDQKHQVLTYFNKRPQRIMKIEYFSGD